MGETIPRKKDKNLEISYRFKFKKRLLIGLVIITITLNVYIGVAFEELSRVTGGYWKIPFPAISLVLCIIGVLIASIEKVEKLEIRVKEEK